MRVVFSSLRPAVSSQYIIKFCSKSDGNYKVPHSSSPGSFIFVKKGNVKPGGRGPYPRTFLQSSSKLPHAPRVAHAYEVFDDGCGSTYLVMEFISAPSFETLINATPSGPDQVSLRTMAITKIAGAIAWLLRCPVPEGDSIGPVGGGNIQHIFNMENAPVAFATSGALEAYLNEALSHLPGRRKYNIELATGTRLYSPSDVAFENFLWDGELVSFVDWQHVNLLPQSFASFYFHSTTDKLVRAVASQIDLPRSTKLGLIEAAAGNNPRARIPDYSLDEYGKKRRSA